MIIVSNYPRIYKITKLVSYLLCGAMLYMFAFHHFINESNIPTALAIALMYFGIIATCILIILWPIFATISILIRVFSGKKMQPLLVLILISTTLTLPVFMMGVRMVAVEITNYYNESAQETP